jgi:hypothetical protein
MRRREIVTHAGKMALLLTMRIGKTMRCIVFSSD